MKKNNWQIQIRNKYYHLLGMLITFLFILPFIPGKVMHLPIVSLIFLLGIIFTLRAVQTNGKAFWVVTLIGLLAYIFQVVSGFFIVHELQPVFYLATGIIFSIFILMSVIFLIVKMFTAKEITSDTIAGGISVYLLLGFLWVLFYYTIYMFDKNAFHFPSSFTSYSLFYFSFSTITTIGYGDIYPVNKIAMSFSNLEAIAGQMYVAIFIARLVGLHIINVKK